MKYILTPEGRILNKGTDTSPIWDWEYYLKDHLGNVRVVIAPTEEAGYSAVQQETHYYPYGMRMSQLSNSANSTNDWLFSNKQLESNFDLGWYDFEWRNYMPDLIRTNTVDPHAENFYSWSTYSMFGDNPVINIDPTGMDWYDINGKITWHDQEGDLTIDDQTYQSLGKNVLVGTHNRDEDGNEEINSATFSLYLESNKDGASATINGNTVPADIEKYGTLAEGLYNAEYSTYKGDGAILIEGGGDVPTVSGNPNNPDNYNADGSLKPTSGHVMDEVLFHKGNWARESLSTNMFRNGKRVQISEGCQTGGCGPRSLPKYREFIKNAVGFKGKYYLKAKPNKK
ncbi:MAG: hypothetical protein K9H26_19405 [Prolixibacteraceae bacterium]|nr:hypothetical protein [Prolixibacteraceae bacterium]